MTTFPSTKCVIGNKPRKAQNRALAKQLHILTKMQAFEKNASIFANDLPFALELCVLVPVQINDL